MDEDFAWQLRLQGTPSEVFECLIRAADSEGRLYDLNESDAALTYTPRNSLVDQTGWIRATVRPCPDGAMVNIVPLHRLTSDQNAIALQAASVASLIGELRRYYPQQVVIAVP